MTYKEALAYLYGFVDFEQLPGAAPKRMDLAGIRSLTDALGHPERQWKSVHVAGTKGKGSTAAMIAAIVRESGYRVGLYTSPHLLTLRERIQVDGEAISESEFARLTARAQPAVEGVRLRAEGMGSFFDILTALAFMYFKERRVDLAVVECGLGGRLDSTNVVSPLVSAITPIGLDHTDRLGGTIAEIAREKAGIIKEGAATVSAAQPREAAEIIRETCRLRSSPLAEIGVEVRYGLKKESIGRQVFDIDTAAGRYERVALPLSGAYQAGNAALAAGVTEALARRGIELTGDAVRRGLATVALPGRMQILETRPWLVLDGAHNVLAAENLTGSLRRLFPARRVIAVLSAHRDKVVGDLCATIARYADEIYVPERRVMRNRQADPEEVAAACRKHGTPARSAPSVATAIAEAKAAAKPDDLILVTGCFALVGEALEVLYELEPEETQSR